VGQTYLPEVWLAVERPHITGQGQVGHDVKYMLSISLIMEMVELHLANMKLELSLEI
jgi:hypothetical protein